MQGTPLWMRGDSNRGLVLWPVPDGVVLSVHLDSEATDLHLTVADAQALHAALGPLAAAPAPSSAPAVVAAPAAKAKAGPPCDRCKGSTSRTPDGYACTQCGNTIVWV